MSDPYVYPGSDVLINKFNIRAESELAQKERKWTSIRIYQIESTSIKGKFDFEHLKAIHHHIFQDIYTWAGRPRSIDMGKDLILFCPAKEIASEAQSLFSMLKLDKHLKGIKTSRFIQEAAYYLAKINQIHPFREGNGRAQREFIREPALEDGIILDWSRTNRAEMLSASVAARGLNNRKMERVMSRVMSGPAKIKETAVDIVKQQMEPEQPFKAGFTAKSNGAEIERTARDKGRER